MTGIEKIMATLEGLKMTIISGIFLAISLAFIITQTPLPYGLDPAWMTIIISGIPLLYLALTRLIYQRWVSSALLICIAMFASIYIGEIFAAGEVTFIMALGALLEDYTVEKSKQGLQDLIKLKPQKARIIEEEKIREVKIEEVKTDQIIRVLPGEVIPVDGVIIKGDTSVDQSIMTGESLPLDKTVDDEVYSGTYNLYGSVDIKTTKISKDSSLEKLIRLIIEADQKQAPTQRIADKWATWLVPIALAIAIATYFITGELVRAVTILVVFCPCALILATPTAIMAAIGQATKHGVLIKSGKALEDMGSVKSITFDKTGTLTYGKLEVSDVITLNDEINEERLLKLLATSEIRSEHPLAKAVINYVENKNLEIQEPNSFKMIAGKGVIVNSQDDTIYAGTTRLLEENNIKMTDESLENLEKLRSEGKATIIIALNDEIIGIVALSDILRENSKYVVEELTNNLDTNVYLLTGDNKSAATYFASKVGITNVYSDLLPEDKVEEVKNLKRNGDKTCMVGDGINDALAFKNSDVGVVMGSIGSDVAIEAADIALLGDDIDKLIYLKKLSNSTLFTIHLSITISMIINAVAIVLSVMGVLDPITGALVHNIGSCAVVMFAASLYDRNFDYGVSPVGGGSSTVG